MDAASCSSLRVKVVARKVIGKWGVGNVFSKRLACPKCDDLELADWRSAAGMWMSRSGMSLPRGWHVHGCMEGVVRAPCILS